MRWRLLTAASLVVMCAAIWTSTGNLNTPTDNPTLSVPCTVSPGGSVNGNAKDCDDPIEVTATWEDTGDHLAGSPDSGLLEGETNRFNFPVPATGSSGRRIVIVAEDIDGNETVKEIDVL